MKIGDIYNVKINEVDKFGHGICKINGIVVFVKGVFLKEEVKIRISKVNKRYMIGEVISFIKKDCDRKDILCKHFYECGGCLYQHITFDLENIYKENIIKSEFSKYRVRNIISGDSLYYRNKVTFHVKNGKIGYYKENSNDLVSITRCHLLDKKIIKIYDMLLSFRLEKVTKIIIRSTTLDEIMIIFDNEINEEDINLLSKCDYVKSIYIKEMLVYGNTYIKNKINSFIYTIYPNSFMQINDYLVLNLYNKILEYAGCGNRLLDLYCGVGTISIFLSSNYKKIDGVEIVFDSILNANLNKEINKIDNVDFICGDASIVSDKYYDTIIVDPPRCGLSKKVINNILSMCPKKVIYTSCNYKTLKKDLQLLEQNYEVVEITPFNMFPRTKHIECVCLLVKKTI